MTSTPKTYKEMDTIRIPESIPQIGIRAGDAGVVDSVYDEGRMLLVEVSRTSDGLFAILDIATEPDLRIVSYSKLD
ncbi:MAG: hypothetical protein H0U04_06450 [Rubrobacter sp.]|jgi:hypothetical protein|nr:hypothetical protein [Rubrobacter sp.]